jgi:hypothetical protein
MRFWKARRKPVARGDVVAYVRDPGLYGVMTVTEITFRGWVVCEDADGRHVGKFQPDELDAADKYFVPAQPC